MAASFILVVVLSYFFFFQNNNGLVQNPISQTPADVLPASSKAVLTLSDGRTIILDTATRGLLTQDKGTRVMVPGDGMLLKTIFIYK
jgi:hypothetical protein